MTTTLITEQYRQLFSRNDGNVNAEEQQRLRDARVAIAGVGGVGGIQLVNLARAGVGGFHIADPEVFGPSDRNRQYGALESTAGCNKAEVMTCQVRDINPECTVRTFADGVNSDNLSDFLDGVDVVIDAIEYFTMQEKIRLYEEARRRGLYVFTAPIIAFGTTLMVFDPRGMTYEEYLKLDPATGQIDVTRLCPILPDYMDLTIYAEALSRKRSIPSFPTSAALSGTLLAHEVLMYLTGRRMPEVAPRVIQLDLFRRGFDVIDVTAPSSPWADFWTEFAREAYDTIYRLSENRRMLTRVAALVGDAPHVLDAGCGTGNLITHLADGRTVTAIDFSPGMVEAATAKTRALDHVTVRQGDVTALNFPDARFDAVTSVNVLFNLDDPGKALREMHRVLKPGGVLVVSSPLAGRGLSPEQQQLVLSDCAENGVSRDSIGKVWAFQMRMFQSGGFKFTPTVEEISALLTANGFRVMVTEEAYYQTNFLIQAIRV